MPTRPPLPLLPPLCLPAANCTLLCQPQHTVLQQTLCVGWAGCRNLLACQEAPWCSTFELGSVLCWRSSLCQGSEVLQRDRVVRGMSREVQEQKALAPRDPHTTSRVLSHEGAQLEPNLCGCSGETQQGPAPTGGCGTLVPLRTTSWQSTQAALPPGERSHGAGNGPGFCWVLHHGGLAVLRKKTKGVRAARGGVRRRRLQRHQVGGLPPRTAVSVHGQLEKNQDRINMGPPEVLQGA